MDEKPDEIMSHIESQRDQLGRNLNELESRVKSATDWRVQFDKNPMLMMGVALGGGLLLGSIVGGSKKSSSSRSDWSSRSYSAGSSGYAASASNLSSAGSTPSASSTSPAVREQKKKATDTLEHIKAALVGFATAKVKEFMTEALPGFNNHLEEAERKHGSSSHGSNSSSYDQQPGFGGSGSGSQSGGSSGSYGNQGSTRTEQSSNSPYTGQTTGLNT
jgi:hypothetical protein